MKKRTNFIGKVKQGWKKHAETVIMIGILITMFLAGYLVSWNCLEKPLDDSQFERCEEVARNVFEQKENVIVEVPNSEEFCINVDTTTITVQIYHTSGKVIATLQNGELIITRDTEIGKAIGLSIAMGILFIMLVFVIVGILCVVWHVE